MSMNAGPSAKPNRHRNVDLHFSRFLTNTFIYNEDCGGLNVSLAYR
ncbi:MAG: hypothetical protein ACXU9U_04730 [Parachlamydiaceae bacterium]